MRRERRGKKLVAAPVGNAARAQNQDSLLVLAHSILFLLDVGGGLETIRLG